MTVARRTRSLAAAAALCAAACNALSGVGDYAFDAKPGGGGQGGEGGAACSEDPCKLTLPQCGCPEGTMCTLDPSGRICVTEGQNAVGEVCGGANGRCVPGAVCVTVKSGLSTCREVCTSDADCEPPGGLCVQTLTNDGQPIPGVVVCSQNCEPISDQGCPVQGTTCRIGWDEDNGDRPFTYCSGTGTGQQGAVCTTWTECAAGFTCATDANDITACRQYCVVGQMCPSGMACSKFDPPALVGGTEYGACL